MINALLMVLAHKFNFLHRVEYPAIYEKFSLLVSNTIAILIFVLLLWLILKIRKVPFETLLKHSLSLFLLLSFFSRGIFLYNYDLPIALFCFLADILTLLVIFTSLGKTFLDYFNHSTTSEKKTLNFITIFYNLMIGISLTAIFTPILTNFLSIHKIHPIPFWGIHLLAISFTIWQIHKINFQPAFHQIKLNKLNLIPFFILICVITPYLFHPSPPDADIQAQNEVVGYFLQGYNYNFIKTGVLNEAFSINYPPATSNVAYLICWLLNTRSSESLLLLWFIGIFLLFITFHLLSRALNISPYLVTIFLITIPIFGSQGFSGGQLPEMLCFTFGSLMAYFLIIQDSKSPDLKVNTTLAASIFCSAPLALIFCFIWAAYFAFITLPHLIKTHFLRTNQKLNFKLIINNKISAISGFLILTFAVMYTIYLGGSDGISKELYRSDYFTNLIANAFGWMYRDLSFLSVVLLVIPIMGFFKSKFNLKSSLILFTWLVAAFLWEGILDFTYEPTGIVRHISSFKYIGVFCLSIGVFAKLLPFNKRLVILTFTILWLLFYFPSIVSIPVPSLTSHSDIRMARIIEKNYRQNSLIANIQAPNDIDWKVYNQPLHSIALRGNSSTNTLFGTNAYVKTGTKLDRRTFSNIIALKPKELKKAFKNLGVTHIMLCARAGNDAFAQKLGKYKLKINKSYLFEL